MFTGIIAEQGTVVELTVHENSSSATLVLMAPASSRGLDLGGSIAVNGVCLTATQIQAEQLSMDVIGETLDRTTMGSLRAGDRVNLERCVPAGGRLDGHIVQGHIDGVGTLAQRNREQDWESLRFAVPARLARYIAEKGSIAIDGVSLTVTNVSPAAEQEPWFEVGLIPTTLTETGLGAKQIGAAVNLEVDVLAKYTERLLSFAPTQSAAEPAGEKP